MIKHEYVNYRLNRAFEALHDAKILAENERWNSAINRLYYATYYAVIALLIKNDIQVHTHDGARNQFGLYFIKTGKIDKNFGLLFSKLFDYRLKGDYGDLFDFDKFLVEPLIDEVESFLNVLKAEIA